MCEIIDFIQSFTSPVTNEKKIEMNFSKKEFQGGISVYLKFLFPSIH